MGDVTVPLGRGITLVDFDEDGKISRIKNVAEAPWKAIGRVAVAVGNLMSAASGGIDGVREAASEALCDVVEIEIDAISVITLIPGTLLDTTLDGHADAMASDVSGEGRPNALILLEKEQAKLSEPKKGPASPTASRSTAAAVTMGSGASTTLRRGAPQTAGGQAIVGFYDAFNMRNLDGLGHFITDDCVYEDLLLGSATVISGKQNLIDTLRFHPAFAAEQCSLPFMDKIPPITLEVIKMVEGGDNVVGIEWQAMVGDKELPLGRGLSQVRICPETGKIERVTDIAEAAWRVLGMLAKPALPLLELLEEHAGNSVGDRMASAPTQALSVTHGQLVDTTGDGEADSVLIDSDGDGRVDKLVLLSDCPVPT